LRREVLTQSSVGLELKAMNPPSRPFVSAIVPVYNDAERLKLCLQALEQQTYPQCLYEVIVVDNNSTEDLQPIVSQFQHAILTRESRPGSYIARNRGIALAKGEVLAFTDSDCIPAADWIETGVERLTQTPNCGLVGGNVRIFCQNDRAPTAVELYDRILAFPQKSYVEKDKFGVTANLFTHLHVMSAVGLFDEQLQSGGDYEWGQRVHRAGYEAVYAEATCVDHPARVSYQELGKKVARVVRGQYALKDKKAYDLRKFFQDIFKDLVPPIKFAIGVYQDHPDLTLIQTLQVVKIRWMVKSHRVWERTKLLLKWSTS
jgi:glycosyltransferase involved in cell wall biosynthesis